MTLTTPLLARQAARNMIDGVHVSDIPGMLNSLAMQVETLTHELDALKRNKRAAWGALSQPLPQSVADAFDQA